MRGIRGAGKSIQRVVCPLVCTFRSSSFVRKLFPGPGEETRASPERKDKAIHTRSWKGFVRLRSVPIEYAKGLGRMGLDLAAPATQQ